MAAKKQTSKVSQPAKPVQPVSAPSSGKKQVNWILVLVMSIVFGYFGVDRFIMGKVGTGILKLAITLVTLGFGGCVWWIIDIVLIATKSPSLNVEFTEN
jgi:TM2 domain-containing membrane protein YozV